VPRQPRRNRSRATLLSSSTRDCIRKSFGLDKGRILEETADKILEDSDDRENGKWGEAQKI